MPNKKFRDYFDSIWFSSLQAKMAVISFFAGVIIACICLFYINPIGEIASSAISIVSELLILSGGCLGVKVGFDIQKRKFENKINELSEKINDKIKVD